MSVDDAAAVKAIKKAARRKKKEKQDKRGREKGAGEAPFVASMSDLRAGHTAGSLRHRKARGLGRPED